MPKSAHDGVGRLRNEIQPRRKGELDAEPERLCFLQPQLERRRDLVLPRSVLIVGDERAAVVLREPDRHQVVLLSARWVERARGGRDEAAKRSWLTVA